MSTIPVICDKCRSTGVSGEGDFSHLGDLLDFTPVPRKKERVDGWNAEKQRAFIAALAATGSKRQASMSIGMAAYGVDQLLKADRSDSFRAAYDRAMAIARQNGTMRIARGVADAAARSAYLNPRSGLRGNLPPDETEAEVSEEQKLELLESLGTKFMKKVAVERQARLGGQIVAADFYLRQITFLEVLFDLSSEKLGWNAADVLRQLRRGAHELPEIVSTSFSDLLDASRREWWAKEGDPNRPAHPDVRFLERHRSEEGDYTTNVDQHGYGKITTPARGYTEEEWRELTVDQQMAARKIQFEEDAREQIEWESRARAELEARQQIPPRNGEGDHPKDGGGAGAKPPASSHSSSPTPIGETPSSRSRSAKGEGGRTPSVRRI
jgi:hypothetical protein